LLRTLFKTDKDSYHINKFADSRELEVRFIKDGSFGYYLHLEQIDKTRKEGIAPLF
jgi:hypothetical protein